MKVSFHKVREHFRKKGETHVDTYERGQGSPAVAPSGPYVAPSESRPKEPSAGIFARLHNKIDSQEARNDRQLKKEIAEAQKKKAEKEAKIEADAINAKRKQEEIESKAREKVEIAKANEQIRKQSEEINAEKRKAEIVKRAEARANRPSLRSQVGSLAKKGFAAYQASQKQSRRSAPRKTRRSAKKTARKTRSRRRATHITVYSD